MATLCARDSLKQDTAAAAAAGGGANDGATIPTLPTLEPKVSDILTKRQELNTLLSSMECTLRGEKDTVDALRYLVKSGNCMGKFVEKRGSGGGEGENGDGNGDGGNGKGDGVGGGKDGNGNGGEFVGGMMGMEGIDDIDAVMNMDMTMNMGVGIGTNGMSSVNGGKRSIEDVDLSDLGFDAMEGMEGTGVEPVSKKSRT